VKCRCTTTTQSFDQSAREGEVEKPAVTSGGKKRRGGNVPALNQYDQPITRKNSLSPRRGIMAKKAQKAIPKL